MAKLQILKNGKGGRDIIVNGKKLEDVLSATIHVDAVNLISLNVEIAVEQVDINDDWKSWNPDKS